MPPKLRVALSELGDMPLFSTAEAEARGISRRDLAVLVRRGLLWRVARGWYSSRIDASAEEAHVLRAVATLRLQDAQTVAARHTAAVLHGLPLARTDLTVVEIAKQPSTHGRVAKGVRVSEMDMETIRPVEVEIPDLGVTVSAVPAAVAIVGTALSNNPLAALVAGDHALRHEVCTRAQIEEALTSARGAKGVARAREVLAHLEPRHESPGETLTAAVLRRSPWTFEPQVWARAAGHDYRLDFAIREIKLAVEFDGDIKYTSPDVMTAQIVRENNLRAEGWEFERVTWSHFEDEEEILRRVTAKAYECEAA